MSTALDSPAACTLAVDMSCPATISELAELLPERSGFVATSKESPALPEIPSQIAKFRLQIVENRSQFRPKNLSPLSTQLEGVGASQLLGVQITAWCWYAALIEPGTPRQVP